MKTMAATIATSRTSVIRKFPLMAPRRQAPPRGDDTLRAQSPTPGARRPYDGRLSRDRFRDLRLAARGDALLRARERLLRGGRVRAGQGSAHAGPGPRGGWLLARADHAAHPRSPRSLSLRLPAR